jgi:uncharacterized membrane protein
MTQTQDRGLLAGPMDRLKSETRDLLGAVGDRAASSLRDRVGDTTNRLAEYAEGGGGPGLAAAVTGAKDLAEGKSPTRALLGAGVKGAKESVGSLFRKGKGGGKGKKLKVTNIVESIDVGVPVRLAYNQWTQFTDFPSFMKKVEDVNQEDEVKASWKAQVFWSHRSWQSTIVDQVPDDRIVWRSEGEKGHVDGAVTFHELAPNLTRILVVLEYHPQGLFEHTGNLWRAQGRRVRLELKHFRRHVMSEAILHSEEIEGWRGEIHDGEVARDHESAVAEEQDDETQEGRGEEAEDYAGGRRDEDAGGPEDDEEPGAEDEYSEDDYDQGEDAEDDYAEDEYAEDEDAEDEYPEESGETGDGQAGGGRRARPAEGGRTAGRGRRPVRRQPRDRSNGAEGRPQRTPRRRAAARRGEDR